jgi:ATP-dependent DNA helicase RecQ
LSDSIHSILKKYWGYSSFRPLQEDIIQAVLQQEDVLALLPTGGGKSICFQVPTMMVDGICLVISPLIALIKDQVTQLSKRGIPTLAVYSGMSFAEVKKTLQNAAFGNYKFLYVSPERLETALFLEFLPAIKPALIVVDEAHCISQWGYDFRPSYLRIAALREQLPEVPVIALTASATPKVQDDICEKLALRKNNSRFRQSFERANLSYSVFQPVSKQTKLLEILQNVPGSSIVYCKSRKLTQQVAALLKLHGISADFYHAGLTNAERTARQESWINNTTRTIVCTNAFGMGIDKPDVRTVIHYDLPDCLENYYQEAGRAGRDGKRAYAVLLYEEREAKDLLSKSSLKFPSAAEIKTAYTALMNHLQVAAGSGEGMSFDIDIDTFAAHFKLNILQASFAIQAMAQEGLLSYNEIVFKPSTVIFTASRNDLEELERQHPELDAIVKGLLRSYEGILDYPTPVYENQLAKFLQLSFADLVTGLKALQRYHIIRYDTSSEKRQVFLLKNRMYADDFVIDNRLVEERRKNYETRLGHFIGYVRNTIDCRSQGIAAYFGDPNVKACTICDNCINNKQSVLSIPAFKNISGNITDLLQKGPQPLAVLLQLLKPAKEADAWKVIDFMIAENLLSTDGEQNLQLRLPGK